MQATTIKIEDPMLSEIKNILPKDQSLSAFIREVLEREIRRRKMIDAGNQYAEFLAGSASEREWLEDWESADLTNAPSVSATKRRKS
jgi:hypothetical protein